MDLTHDTGVLDRKLCTITQACMAVHVSRRTMYNWMESGKVDVCWTASGARRIYVDSLTQDTEPEPRKIRGSV